MSCTTWCYEWHKQSGSEQNKCQDLLSLLSHCFSLHVFLDNLNFDCFARHILHGDIDFWLQALIVLLDVLYPNQKPEKDCHIRSRGSYPVDSYRCIIEQYNIWQCTLRVRTSTPVLLMAKLSNFLDVLVEKGAVLVTMTFSLNWKEVCCFFTFIIHMFWR